MMITVQPAFDPHFSCLKKCDLFEALELNADQLDDLSELGAMVAWELEENGTSTPFEALNAFVYLRLGDTRLPKAQRVMVSLAATDAFERALSFFSCHSQPPALCVLKSELRKSRPLLALYYQHAAPELASSMREFWKKLPPLALPTNSQLI